MTTPVSSATPYCTVQQFFDSYDCRTVGDLIGDEDKRVDRDAMLQTGTPANLRLVAILQRASGMVEAACLKGNRYAVADLQGLTQATDAAAGNVSNAALLLADIVAGIAMWKIWERRPTRFKDMELPLSAQQAVNMLDALEAGDKIFPLQEVMDAGNPSVDYQSHHDIYKRNPMSAQARRFFGRTNEWNVPGPSGLS